MEVESVLRSARDLVMLAYLGFPKDAALSLVSVRHSLSKRDMFALKKIVRWPDEAISSALKKVPPRLMEGRRLRVDAFNVLATVEAIMRGEPVFLCNDGFIRDTSSAYRSYRAGKDTEEAILMIIRAISRFDPRNAEFVFDQPISGSGELAALTRSLMRDQGLEGGAKTSKNADLEVSEGEVAASSDVGVISRAELVIDIPERILEELGASPRRLWKGF